MARSQARGTEGENDVRLRNLLAALALVAIVTGAFALAEAVRPPDCTESPRCAR